MASLRILPSVDYLQECFVYDPYTGSLTWKRRPLSHFPHSTEQLRWTTRHAGKEAGCTVIDKRSGYLSRTIHVAGIKYKVARVVYKLMTNEEPPEVDHIDTNPLNMRWNNLRGCTHSQNIMNHTVRKDSASGFKGVNKSKIRKKNPYQAYIIVDKKFTSLGCYPTAEEASAVYCAAAARLHGEFHRK